MSFILFFVASQLGFVVFAAQLDLHHDVLGPSHKFLGSASSRKEMVSEGPEVLSVAGIQDGIESLVENQQLVDPHQGAIWRIWLREIDHLVEKGEDDSTFQAVLQMKDVLKEVRKKKEMVQALHQRFLDNQINAINRCSPKQDDTGDMLVGTPLGENVSDVGHLAVQAEKHTSTHCEDIEEAIALLKRADCAEVKNVEAECMCHQVIAQAHGVKPECHEGYGPAANGKKCCDAYARLVLHRKDCTNKESDKNSDAKQHSEVSRKVCSKYEACYAKEVKEYVALKDSMKLKEKGRQWQSLYHMECLLNSFDTSPSHPYKINNAVAKECKEGDYKVMSVDYPEIPPKEKCP